MKEIEFERRLKMSMGNTGSWAGSLHSELTGRIIGASLAIELRAQGIPFRTQVPIPMLYRGESVGDFFADFIVDRKVIVELKAVEVLRGVHRAQVLSYLRATELELALLINFNVGVLKNGVRRLIHSRVCER
jgi:GxxExxY protein